jgi:hypothetical protein
MVDSLGYWQGKAGEAGEVRIREAGFSEVSEARFLEVASEKFTRRPEKLTRR